VSSFHSSGEPDRAWRFTRIGDLSIGLDRSKQDARRIDTEPLLLLGQDQRELDDWQDEHGQGHNRQAESISYGHCASRLRVETSAATATAMSQDVGGTGAFVSAVVNTQPNSSVFVESRSSLKRSRHPVGWRSGSRADRALGPARVRLQVLFA